MAPCHTSKTGRKFYLLPDADRKGVGYCYVCKEALDPYDIIAGFHGGGFREAYEDVKAYVGFDPENVSEWRDPGNWKPPVVEDDRPSEKHLAQYKKQRDAMYKAWDESIPLTHPDAEVGMRYLRHRGFTAFDLDSDSVRFHRAQSYYRKIEDLSNFDEVDDEMVEEYANLLNACESSPYFMGYHKKGDEILGAKFGVHPCIMYLLRDGEGNPRRVSRLYLNRDGYKLDFPEKKLFPVKKLFFANGETESISGAACYLDKPSKVMLIAEGFETVGVGRSYIKLPSAMTFNTGGMAKLDIPSDTKLIFALVDKDRSIAGTKAVYSLMERAREQGVIVVPVFIPLPIPEGESGLDWADVLNLPDGEQYLPEFMRNFHEQWDWLAISEYFFAELEERAAQGLLKA
ncbi:toprim domain-containing protein [Vibrio sp. PNB22_3_1]